MTKKSVVIDVIIFIVIVMLLLVVIPVISSILKQLIILQIIVIIAGAIALRYLVQKIRKRLRDRSPPAIKKLYYAPLGWWRSLIDIKYPLHFSTLLRSSTVYSYSRIMATARHHPALPPVSLTGKQATSKPNGRGSLSRLASFSIWQYSFSMPAR